MTIFILNIRSKKSFKRCTPQQHNTITYRYNKMHFQNLFGFFEDCDVLWLITFDL